MGELQHAVGRRGTRLTVAGALAIALVVGFATGCDTEPTGSVVSASPSDPQGSAATGGPPPSAQASVSPAPAIDPTAGRLVWLVDRAGGLGVWTTDLAGGDVHPYLSGLDEEGTAIRDARLVDEDVALIRDRSGRAGDELWVVSRSRPPRLLMSGVTSFVARSASEILAVVDIRTMRTIWRVPLNGTAPISIAQLQVPDHGPQVGPFGFAISPDGRTVAAGWVGGPLEVIGPMAASYDDKGAPLVVADDGRLVAVTGRAGEAYLVDGDRLVELAPTDSDPLALPGTGWVAWPSVGEDGGLVAVEVRDLLAGTNEIYPAGGLATNVRELTPSHVVLEATAFDPLRRTVTVVDRRDGRSTTFEALAPEAD